MGAVGCSPGVKRLRAAISPYMPCTVSSLPRPARPGSTSRKLGRRPGGRAGGPTSRGCPDLPHKLSTPLAASLGPAVGWPTACQWHLLTHWYHVSHLHRRHLQQAGALRWVGRCANCSKLERRLDGANAGHVAAQSRHHLPSHATTSGADGRILTGGCGYKSEATRWNCPLA